MKKFEYKKIHQTDIDELNKLGLDGWELVSVVQVFSGNQIDNNICSSIITSLYIEKRSY